MNFSLVIPTYKRQEALKKALESVLINSMLPSEVFVIDDDTLEPVFLEEWSKKCEAVGVAFRYHKKNHKTHRRGLAESKNLALDLVQEKFIFYIDDDVVLDKKYFEEMMKIWEGEGSSKLFGVGGKIVNNRKQSWFEKNIFNKIFGLEGELPWDINDVGFQVWDEDTQEAQKAYYFHGGASSYKKELLKEFKFREFSGGRSGLEDVELALRGKRAGYYFIYNPLAQLAHYHEQSGRESIFLSVKKESQNRKEIFKSLCTQDFRHKLWFIWADIGWMIKKMGGLILRT